MTSRHTNRKIISYTAQKPKQTPPIHTLVLGGTINSKSVSNASDPSHQVYVQTKKENKDSSQFTKDDANAISLQIRRILNPSKTTQVVVAETGTDTVGQLACFLLTTLETYLSDHVVILLAAMVAENQDKVRQNANNKLNTLLNPAIGNESSGAGLHVFVGDARGAVIHFEPKSRIIRKFGDGKFPFITYDRANTQPDKASPITLPHIEQMSHAFILIIPDVSTAPTDIMAQVKVGLALAKKSGKQIGLVGHGNHNFPLVPGLLELIEAQPELFVITTRTQYYVGKSEPPIYEPFSTLLTAGVTVYEPPSTSDSKHESKGV